jgi:hypothetical protein
MNPYMRNDGRAQSVENLLDDESSWNWRRIDPFVTRIAYLQGLYARLLPQDREALKIGRLRINCTCDPASNEDVPQN